MLDSTIDTSRCPSSVEDDYRVSNAALDMVACLSYNQGGGNAYHAAAGQCVVGETTQGSMWNSAACHEGNLTVQARLTGTTDKSLCSSYTDTTDAVSFTARWQQLDIALCLSMNYPDAAGYARVGMCLLNTESGHPGGFEATACNPSLPLCHSWLRRPVLG